VAYSLQLPKSLDNVLQENLHKIDPAMERGRGDFSRP